METKLRMDKCPYCGSKVELRDSKLVYGRSYGMIWICSQYPLCNAFVGCHKGSNRPLGRLADPILREWKKRAHAVFDPVWKSKRLDRGQAYVFLRDAMKMTADEAHVGKFDVPECQRLVKAMQSDSMDNLITRWKEWKKNEKV